MAETTYPKWYCSRCLRVVAPDDTSDEKTCSFCKYKLRLVYSKPYYAFSEALKKYFEETGMRPILVENGTGKISDDYKSWLEQRGIRLYVGEQK